LSVRRLPENPFVMLGLVVLAGTAATALLADVPSSAMVVQSLLPAVVGVAMVGYGWHVREAVTTTGRTVLTWTGAGVLVFFVVGFWFGQTSRLLETSFLLAMYSSLATGAAFGATVGVYAARLQRSKATLQRETDRLEEFASIVSHDLRTPLGVAKGRLDLARDIADGLGEEPAGHLADARDALDRMDALIDELLALAREGEATGTRRIDLAAVADRCWADLDADEAELVDDDAPPVVADPGLLGQLLENLLSNAVEHGSKSARESEDAAEHGGDTVTVGALPDGFYVADDGPGVPDSEREQVFETGYTTVDDGAGIGLGVVRRVADAHGWEVAVGESASGGARFEVTGVDRE
jgi:signal transduction histidine kinase